MTSVVPAIASPCRTVRAYAGQRLPAAAQAIDLVATVVAYELADWMPTGSSNISDALYEAYALQSISVPGARAQWHHYRYQIRPSRTNHRASYGVDF